MLKGYKLYQNLIFRYVPARVRQLVATITSITKYINAADEESMSDNMLEAYIWMCV